MVEHEFEALDFPVVLEQFASFAASSKTAQKIREATILEDVYLMRHDLSLAAEAFVYLQKGGMLSLGGLRDITKHVLTAQKKITLLPSELLDISFFLSACQATSQAFDAQQSPLLHEIASTLTPCKSLSQQIDASIDLSGQVRMDATAKLRHLNNALIQARADLANGARRFIRTHESSLVDTVTVSSGSRVCVLVKATDKYKFGGMVHGMSQSQAACYLEPDALVELNNRVADTLMEIENEKKRICQELTSIVSKNGQALLSNDESMEIIDMAIAKGHWMNVHDGCIPTLHTKNHQLRIEHAVHPLLDPKKAIANRYSMSNQTKCLMITGSNMGGKTVTLKTIGLFLLLAHCGYPVSAHEALLPLYSQFYFDIGDEQSIENNLSTFSAHATKLAHIVTHCDANTFVLLDEIGSGTDPQEGASLAQAVLETLMDKGATILTSTHYSQVKTFGSTHPHIQVGSVEFDPETLKPTYRYLEGVSGSSCAFPIARQLGMPQEVLQRSNEIKEENESETTRQLEVLEQRQAQLQKQKDRFDALIANAHDLQRQAKHDQEKWQEMKERLDREYAKELDDMLYEKKEEARQIIKVLRDQTNSQNHEQIEQLGKLDALNQPIEQGKQEQPNKVEITFKEGDYVRIPSLNNHGEIQSIRRGKANVLVNGRKVVVSVDQLLPMEKPKPPKRIRKQHIDRQFKAFPMELNLIGMRVEEGMNALDHYLDQAVYHRVKNVRIIHGMGTGALRNAVWANLRKHPQVKQITSAGPGEGGLGATLVELK